jgi:hypothetical protein
MQGVAHVDQEAVVATELLGDLLRFVDEAFALAEGVGAAEEVGDGSGGDVVRTVALRTSGCGGLLARLALFVGNPDVELGLRLVALLEIRLEVGDRVELELGARDDYQRVGLVMLVAMLVKEALLDGVVDLRSLGSFGTLGRSRDGTLRALGRSDFGVLALGDRSHGDFGGLDGRDGLAFGRHRLGHGLRRRLGRGLGLRLGDGSGLLGGLLGFVFLGHRKGGLELWVLGEESLAAPWRYHTKSAGFHKSGDPSPGAGAADAFGLVHGEGQGGAGLRLELDGGDDPKLRQKGLMVCQ